MCQLFINVGDYSSDSYKKLRKSFVRSDPHGHNYGCRYPSRLKSVGDYLYEVLHVEHFTSTPILVDNQQYSVVKLPVYSLPLACSLKLQQLDTNILLHTSVARSISNQRQSYHPIVRNPRAALAGCSHRVTGSCRNFLFLS